MEGTFQSNENEYDTYIEKCFFKKLYDVVDKRYRERIRLSWLSDKQLYMNLTKKIEFEFAHYSLHDSTHSISILQYIQMILGEDIIDQFSVGDLWLLLETAYSHDIGMAVNYQELTEIWKDKQNIKKIIQKISQCSDKEAIEVYNYVHNCLEKDYCKKQININSHEKEMFLEKHTNWPLEFRRAVTLINSEYIRFHHPERSKNKIYELIGQHEGMGIEERLYKIVGIINHLHGMDFKEIEKLLNTVNTGFTTDKIHPRMIALLLRVGDVLDIRNNRFDYLNIKYLGHLPEDSQIHFYKHKSVRDFLVDNENVKVHIDSDQLEVCNNSRIWLDYIDLEMDHLIRFWKIYSDDLPPLQLKKVDLKVTYKGKEFIKNDVIKSLKVNPKPLTELLSGENFYNTKLIVFREYLQNAIDATLLRLALNYRDDKDFLNRHDRESFKKVIIDDFVEEEILEKYEINIEIENDSKDSNLIIFRVVDQGTGMDSQGLDALFNIGKGWKARDTFNDLKDDLPDWMYPTGGFGIGTLSAFLVCDSVKFITKAKKSPQYTVSIESPDNGGKVEKIINWDVEDERIGTTVEFKINIATYLREMYKTMDSIADTGINQSEIDEQFSKFDICDLEYRLNIVEIYLKAFIDNFLVNSMFPIKINVLTRSKYYSNINSHKLYKKSGKNYVAMDNIIVEYNENNLPYSTRFAYKGILVTNCKNIYKNNNFLTYLCNRIISSVDIYDKNVKRILEISRNNFLASFDTITMLNKILKYKMKLLLQSVSQETDLVISQNILADLLLYFHEELVNVEELLCECSTRIPDKDKELYLFDYDVNKYIIIEYINNSIIKRYNDLVNIYSEIVIVPDKLVDEENYEVIKNIVNTISDKYLQINKDEEVFSLLPDCLKSLFNKLIKLKDNDGNKIVDMIKKSNIEMEKQSLLENINTKSLIQFELIKKQKVYVTFFAFLKEVYDNLRLEEPLFSGLFVLDDILNINSYLLDEDQFEVYYYIYQDDKFMKKKYTGIFPDKSSVKLISIEIKNKVLESKINLLDYFNKNGFGGKKENKLDNVNYDGYEAIVLDPYPLNLSKPTAVILYPFDKYRDLKIFYSKSQIREILQQDEYAKKVISYVYEYNKNKGVSYKDVIEKYIALLYALANYNIGK